MSSSGLLKWSFFLSVVLFRSVEGFINRCYYDDLKEDSDLMVNVNCTIVDGLIQASVYVQYDRPFSSISVYSNCSDRMARRETELQVGQRLSYHTQVFHLESNGSCVLFGCVKPINNPNVISTDLGHHTCSGPPPPPPPPTSSSSSSSSSSSDTPSATVTSFVAEDTNLSIEPTTSYMAISPSLAPPHSAETRMTDPELPQATNVRASPFVVAAPLIVVSMVTILVAVVVAAVWCSWSSNRKYSSYQREAMNTIINESAEPSTNFDNSFIFDKGVVPTSLPQSSSTMTLLDGLKFDSESTSASPSHAATLSCMKDSCEVLSDLGYVNDGLHPLSLNQMESLPPSSDSSGISSGRTIERMSSDDVFLPNTVQTATGDICPENLKVGFYNSNFKDHSTSSSEDESSQQYFKPEDRKEGNLLDRSSHDRTYVDYNKILLGGRTLMDGVHVPSTCSPRLSTKLSSGYSSLERGSINRHRVVTETSDICRNSTYNSNEVIVLLTDIPSHDDSGFKSHGDAISMASV